MSPFLVPLQAGATSNPADGSGVLTSTALPQTGTTIKEASNIMAINATKGFPRTCSTSLHTTAPFKELNI